MRQPRPGSSTSGSASTNDAPWPPRDSSHRRPPFASVKPRAIASPSPAPALVGAPGDAVERLEDALALLLGDPGPAVGDADEELLAGRGDPHAARARPAVRAGARSRARSRARAGSATASTWTGGSSAAPSRRRARRRRARRAPVRRARPPSTARAAPPPRRAWSRERSRRFSTSRLSRACSARIVSSSSARSVVGQRELAALEPVERLLDRRERRAQVVRDGLDDRGLDRVAAPEGLGLERLARAGAPARARRRAARRAPGAAAAGSRARAPRSPVCRASPIVPPVDRERMRRLVRASARACSPSAIRDRRDAEDGRGPLLDAAELVLEPCCRAAGRRRCRRAARPRARAARPPPCARGTRDARLPTTIAVTT